MNLISVSKPAERDYGIDLFRGLLVLAVILGHFAEITQRQSLLTWVGTGLRMPIFMGLAGYLFKLEISRSAPWFEVLRRYRDRLILPWLVASLVYAALTVGLGILTPILIFVQPQFHLWFVPVMMAFIAIATLSRRTPHEMLCHAVIISILVTYLISFADASKIQLLIDRRFFIYPVYFFFGVWVAHRTPDKWMQHVAIVLAPMGISWWCTLYPDLGQPSEVAAQMIACIPLICLLPKVRLLALSLPPIATIGRNSLFFYLWHPLSFGLWAAYGATDLSLLVLTLATLIAVRELSRRQWAIARILGCDLSPLLAKITKATPSAAATSG